jgi:DNA-binding response OmpR family regulator
MRPHLASRPLGVIASSALQRDRWVGLLRNAGARPSGLRSPADLNRFHAATGDACALLLLDREGSMSLRLCRRLRAGGDGSACVIVVRSDGGLDREADLFRAGADAVIAVSSLALSRTALAAIAASLRRLSGPRTPSTPGAPPPTRIASSVFGSFS